jgi:hypothetical protein
MNLNYLEEPPLEFGAGKHIDMRFGIMNYGPLDVESALAPKQINVGIVGTAESIDGVRQWLERCKSEICAKPNKGDPAKPNKQPNLFVRFPGFNQDTGFFSSLVLQDSLCRPLLKNELPLITSRADRNERIRRAVDLFMEEIRYLSQNTTAPVIICAVPLSLLEAMGPEENNGIPDEENDERDPGLQLDFHDMLKAGAMQQYRKPIQLLLPSTYDPTKQRQQHKLKLGRELQDEATRAWNIHTALYYKAGGVPWRLPRPSTELTVCYVGVSFYRSLDRQSLLTSVAQVFNERGEGVVVRGGTATISKDDRQAHLPQQHAYELLNTALARYRETHKTFPARIVIHKSSRFDNDEQQGFTAALIERGIATHDLLWVSDSHTRLYRAGQYPPLRGTLLALDEHEMVLYTRGSVPFFETYPGKYIPRPLRIHAASTEQSPQFLAREILSLTKMNWNNTQFDGSEPVTLRASRQCSSVLRYCSEARPIEPRYSYYM